MAFSGFICFLQHAHMLLGAQGVPESVQRSFYGSFKEVMALRVPGIFRKFKGFRLRALKGISEVYRGFHRVSGTFKGISETINKI